MRTTSSSSSSASGQYPSQSQDSTEVNEFMSMLQARSGPVSDLKVETTPLKLLIFLAIKPVQPCGPVCHILLHFLQRHQKVHAQDLFAEVALVERLLQDRLVQPLELRQGKLRRQQFEANRLIANLALETLQGRRHDAI